METTTCSYCSLEVSKIKIGKHIINKHLSTIFSSLTEEGNANRKRLHKKNIDEPLGLTINQDTYYFCFVCNTMVKQRKFGEIHYRRTLNRLKTHDCYGKQFETFDRLCLEYPLEDKKVCIKDECIENIQFLLHSILDYTDNFSFQNSHRFKKLQEQGIDLSVSTLEKLYGKLNPPRIEEEQKEVVEPIKEPVKEIEPIEEDTVEPESEPVKQEDPVLSYLREEMKNESMSLENRQTMIRDIMKARKLSDPVLEEFCNRPVPKPKPVFNPANYITVPEPVKYPTVIQTTKKLSK